LRRRADAFLNSPRSADDEWVLDAYISGRKIKFANHSAKAANCYPRVVQVNGDHRVGIFAKHDILPMTELFYTCACLWRAFCAYCTALTPSLDRRRKVRRRLETRIVICD